MTAELGQIVSQLVATGQWSEVAPQLDALELRVGYACSNSDVVYL